MKLYQYKVSECKDKNIKKVSSIISSMFLETYENENLAIVKFNYKLNNTDYSIVDKKSICEIIFERIKNSFSMKIDDKYNYPNIKSITSCRFISFFPDGVFSICYASDDIIIDISEYAPDAQDISWQLIETDVFDFL